MAQKTLVNKVKSMESRISMILGIIVVIVVGILLFKYFRSDKINPLIEPEVSEEVTPTKENEKLVDEEPSLTLPAKYTVQAGDNLWKISVKYYGYGYNWGDISRENNLKNPSLLIVGQELIIPDVPVKKPIQAGSENLFIGQSSQPQTPITDSSYIIAKGDNLWNISVRAYQDGFKWPVIAKANNLVNPSVIHAGNVLTIPR